jgi:uncharacterized repeat protein (TIGR01451 family)
MTHRNLAQRASFVVLAAFSSLLLTRAAHAEDKGCIELKTTAETEQEYVNDQGQKATRLAPLGKVVPGDQVIWTITAKNICNKPADHIVIDNAVPEHMKFVADSAVGAGTVITYSVDGKQFGPATALSVKDANGTHTATQEEFRHLRWTYQAPFAAGATAFVRYRAVIE